MKNSTISLIRFVSMILIISCHILQGLDNKWAFWINVGVQLFFFIAGYLYGSKNVKAIDFYKKRIRKILIPYSILAIIIFIIEYISLKHRYSILLMVGSILGFNAFNGYTQVLSHTWFVSYILLCYLLVPLLQVIFSNKEFKNNLLYFLLFVIFIQLFELFKVVNINICWINNFIFGYFYTRCCKKNNEKRIMCIIAFIMFIVIMPFAVILQEGLEVDLPRLFIEYKVYIMNYGHIFLGIILFMIMYFIFDKLKIKYNKLLELSDNYSYYIYLVHQIFILFYYSLLFKTDYLVVNIFLIIFASVISAIVLKFISDNVLKIYDKCIK